MVQRQHSTPTSIDLSGQSVSENRIEADTLLPVTAAATVSQDPSPFSRQHAGDTASVRHERIAKAAYRRAESRGFAPGHEIEDWLAAEREVDETPSPA